MNQNDKATTINYNKECKNIITKLFKIYKIQTTPFILLVKKRDHEIFIVTIENIKKALELKQYINP